VQGKPLNDKRVHKDGVTGIGRNYWKANRQNEQAMHNVTMTPLHNDNQQHKREAKHRKCHVPRGGERSPDSESAP
jgi:hypothetical protein